MSADSRIRVLSQWPGTSFLLMALSITFGCGSESGESGDVDDVIFGSEHRYHRRASLRLNVGHNRNFVATNGVEDPTVGTSTQAHGTISDETLGSIVELMPADLIDVYLDDVSTSTSCYLLVGSHTIRWTPHEDPAGPPLVGCWLEDEAISMETRHMLSTIRATTERLLEGGE